MGTHQTFDVPDLLATETLYDDKGRVTRERQFDEGKIKRDDAVFEDGSRKAFAKNPTARRESTGSGFPCVCMRHACPDRQVSPHHRNGGYARVDCRLRERTALRLPFILV